MAFLMISTTNQSILRALHAWSHPEQKDVRRPYVKEEGWIIRKLGPGTYLFELNGASLAILWELKVKYNGQVTLSLVENLYENDLPKEIVKEVNECQTNKNYLTKDRLEQLSKIRPRYSLNLREKSSE